MDQLFNSSRVSTLLSSIENLFGPVLPGIGTEETTISIFRNRYAKRWDLTGQVGILPDASIYVHTQIEIDLTKVKSMVVGLPEDIGVEKPGQVERVAEWRRKNNLE